MGRIRWHRWPPLTPLFEHACAVAGFSPRRYLEDDLAHHSALEWRLAGDTLGGGVRRSLDRYTDGMTAALTPKQLDQILALRPSLTWAGEAAGEPRRLRWSQTDRIDPEGGGNLFTWLLPRTAGLGRTCLT